MSNQTTSGWTAAQDAELRELVEKKFKGREIAEHMHVTRNSVMGRLWRLGISLFRLPGERVIRRRVPRPTVARITQPKKIGPPAALPVHDIPVLKVPLIELECHQCHFPLDERDDTTWLFCGLPKHLDQPYCYDHCAVVYMQ